MAKCKKSNELYKAIKQARSDAREHGNLGVPLHIRNAPTKLMKGLGYGKDYKYPPDLCIMKIRNTLPDKLKGRKVYR